MVVNIVLVRPTPGGTDRYGDPADGTPTRITLADAFVAPRKDTTVESRDRGRQGVIIGLTLYDPTNTTILHTDRVEVDGVLYEVDGEAGRWVSPWGVWAPGTEVALRRTVG